MLFKVVLLALSLSLLGLGAAQQCEGFVGVLGMTPDQLKKEIRANVAAALKEDAITSSENETHVLNKEKLNSMLEKVVDAAIEKRLATALQAIANISNSMEQLVIQMDQSNANIQAIMTQLQHLHLPGSTPSHPATSCSEIKELTPLLPLATTGSGAQVTPLFTCTVT